MLAFFDIVRIGGNKWHVDPTVNYYEHLSCRKRNVIENAILNGDAEEKSVTDTEFEDLVEIGEGCKFCWNRLVEDEGRSFYEGKKTVNKESSTSQSTEVDKTVSRGFYLGLIGEVIDSDIQQTSKLDLIAILTRLAMQT